MNAQKTTTPRSILRWPVVALAIFGVVGTPLGILALIEQDYVMFWFWFIVGDMPASIVLAIIAKYFYDTYRTPRE